MEFSQQLKRWAGRFRKAANKKNQEEMLKYIAYVLRRNIRIRMQTATAPNGEPHEILTEKYLERKLKEGWDPRIWHRTGDSEKAIKSEVSPELITLTIETPYSGYVNDGTKHMPARPVLGLSEEDKYFILRYIETYFKKEIEEE